MEAGRITPSKTSLLMEEDIMILHKKQEQMLRNLTTEYVSCKALAREMLTFIVLDCDISEFEANPAFQDCMTDKAEFIKQVITPTFKGFYELYESEFEPSIRYYLGRDNKFYDELFCEVDLKTVKQTLGTTKAALLKMSIDSTMETKMGEVDFLDDWENLPLTF